MKAEPIVPVWVKITDVAKMLGASRQAVKKWIRAGLLEQAGVGAKLHYVTAASMERFLSTHSRKGA